MDKDFCPLEYKATDVDLYLESVRVESLSYIPTPEQKLAMLVKSYARTREREDKIYLDDMRNVEDIFARKQGDLYKKFEDDLSGLKKAGIQFLEDPIDWIEENKRVDKIVNQLTAELQRDSTYEHGRNFKFTEARTESHLARLQTQEAQYRQEGLSIEADIARSSTSTDGGK